MKTIIEDKYIIFLVFSGVVGLFTNIPKEYGMYAGTGGCAIIIIDLLLVLPPSFAIVWLNKQYEGQILPEYLSKILGKYLSVLINIIYFIRFFVLIPLMTRSLLGIVRHRILDTTPIEPLAFVFLSCACYAAMQGIKSLSYICQFFISVALVLSSILFFALINKGEFINLRPFFVKEDIPLYLKESIRNLRIFFGSGILLLVPFSKKYNKKSNTYLLIGYLIITLFYLLVFWGTISVAGINQTVLFDDIFFITIRSVEIENLEILKRLDGLAITVFISTGLMMSATDIYGAASIIKYYLKKTKFNKKVNFSFYCIIVSILSFILCIMIPDAFALKKYLLLSYKVAWLTSLIIPLLLFVIVKIKRKFNYYL